MRVTHIYIYRPHLHPAQVPAHERRCAGVDQKLEALPVGYQAQVARRNVGRLHGMAGICSLPTSAWPWARDFQSARRKSPRSWKVGACGDMWELGAAAVSHKGDSASCTVTGPRFARQWCFLPKHCIYAMRAYSCYAASRECDFKARCISRS